MGRLSVVKREVVRVPGVNAVPTDDFIADQIGDADSETSAALETIIEQHTPGIELDSAYRDFSFGTTNTDLTNAAGDMPSFTCHVVGQGRPVDLRFHASKVYHSVANTIVNAMIVENGVSGSANNQIGAVDSRLTTDGPSLTITRRTNPLVQDFDYYYQVRFAGAAAGTVTVVAAGFCPIELTATSR